MSTPAALAACVALALVTGCSIGPNYHRPPATVPGAFKEVPPDAFKEAAAQGLLPAEPNDAFHKGKWWEIYNDPALNALEEQVGLNNQNVAQLAAVYQQAKALVRQSRAPLYPTVSAGPAITASKSGGSGAVTGGVVGGASVRELYSLPFSVSWEPDLWGSVHRSVTAAASSAQASEADVENAKLLYQSELAQDYFNLHGTDADAELLERTATSYQDFLTLTQNRFRGGVASDLDVAQAQSQLYSTQSSLIDLGVTRAQFEHAIAVLTGQAPASLTIPAKTMATLPPAVPVALPSQLLERRPDIAASERRVAAANEQIGIAMAAFYPTLSLSASGGFQNTSFVKWFGMPSRFFSVGPSLAETLFEGGRRRAVVAEEQAAYDATVATYRETVLTAFQQVEDELAALRVLEQEAAKVQETIAAADRALTVSTAQYKAGTTLYLTVITEQATLLAAQRTAVALLTRRLVDSVALVQALGGGWDASQLPTRADTAKSK
jgi:NodT family efflux transporter outer membrane factor (OMF) lipoprotein